MFRKNATARLLLNGKDVGEVRVKGSDESWTYGEFQPGDGFSEFAPLFGQWAMLLHEDDDSDRLSSAASEELRLAEAALDRLRAELVFEPEGRRIHAAQINIDGNLIEWKRY